MKHPDSHVWSLCRDQWVSRVGCRHCEDCNMCYDDAWHCTACGKCKIGHWFICDGCRGFSLTGAKYGIIGGRVAQDAHHAQGGLSLGLPKKRAREEEEIGHQLPSEVSSSRRLSIVDTANTRTRRCQRLQTISQPARATAKITAEHDAVCVVVGADNARITAIATTQIATMSRAAGIISD